jgi:hypothetical protein
MNNGDLSRLDEALFVLSLGLTPTIYNDRGDQANRFTLYFDVCLLDLL